MNDILIVRKSIWMSYSCLMSLPFSSLILMTVCGKQVGEREKMTTPFFDSTQHFMKWMEKNKRDEKTSKVHIKTCEIIVLLYSTFGETLQQHQHILLHCTVGSSHRKSAHKIDDKNRFFPLLISTAIFHTFKWGTLNRLTDSNRIANANPKFI